MRDDIWSEEEDRDRPRKPRSVLTVLLIAAVPWAIVAAIVFLPDRQADEPDLPVATPPSDPTAEDVSGDAEPDVTAAEQPGDPASDEEAQEGASPGGDEERASGAESYGMSGSGVTPPGGESHGSGELPLTQVDLRSERALISLATVVARAWATGVDPELPVVGVDPSQQPRYAEHVTVEAVHREGELAVVVLLAVILEQFDDGMGAELRRIAVPLVEGPEHPALAGAPWWLSPPSFAPAEVLATPDEDPEHLRAAEDALRDAGYRDIEVHGLGRSDGWAWIVDVAAVAPGGEPVEGALWLREASHGFELAGDRTAVDER